MSRLNRGGYTVVELIVALLILSLALTGMMGAGKTTVAAILGRLLNRRVVSTDALVERATAKLHEKRCDAIVANDVSARGIGFGSDDNEVTLLFADGERHALTRASKRAIADRLWSLLGAHLPAREAGDA